MDNNEEMDFAALFESRGAVNMQIRNGDKVSGKVITIGKDSIFVDLGGRQDGIIDVKDFQDDDGNLTVREGDIIEAFAVGSDGDGIRLKKHLGGGRGREVDTAVQDAWNKKIPIEGKITGERKGGYSVQPIRRSTSTAPDRTAPRMSARAMPSSSPSTAMRAAMWWCPGAACRKSRRMRRARSCWPTSRRAMCSPGPSAR